MKKILVTGGSGFIGGNFILNQIKNTQNTILNYDKLTYAGCKDKLRHLEGSGHYTFVEGDICDAPLLEKVINDFQPDIIVHFAAESHVDRSIDGPAEFIETNIIGTYILIEEAARYYRSLDKGRDFVFVHISTDEVFGSLGNEGFFHEETPYKPNSPYSASKAASDHLVRAWHKTYGFPAIIINSSNNYGPYQFPEKLIPLMIISCLEEKKLPVYGKGDNIRDWIYVDDFCEIIYKVALRGKPGQTYNIGGLNEKTSLGVTTDICDLLDEIRPRESGKSYRELITYVEDRPGHDFRYAMDIYKVRKELGWEPKESFLSGLRKTVMWYLENETWWLNIKANKYQQQRIGVRKK